MYVLYGVNLKNRLFKVAVVLTLSANLLNQNVFAASSDIFETDKLVDLITLSSFIDYTSDTTQNYATNKDAIAEFKLACQKFAQSNVKTAYREFNKLIHAYDNNDFLYFNLAYEFSQMGLFSLAQNCIVQIDDRQIWVNQIENLKNCYFPCVTMSLDEEIYLAELYSDINYNNYSEESLDELSKNQKLLKKLDYANYIMALAYYKNNNYSKALTYINKAIGFDNSNLHYLAFKAQILSDDKKYKESLNIVDELLDKNITLIKFNDSLNQLKEFNLAKSTRNKYNSMYYLANYHFLKNDSQKALRELGYLVSKKKKNYKAYTLMGLIHFKTGNIEKAKENLERSYLINKKYVPTLVGLGNVFYIIKDYSKASIFYKSAIKQDKKCYQGYLGLSVIALENKDIQNASNYIQEASNIKSQHYIVNYIYSKIDKDREEQYLKSTLALNPMFVKGWLNLAKLKFDNNLPELAQDYIYPVKLIAPNNEEYKSFLNTLNENKNINRL